MSSAQGSPLYRFADCELDAREHRLLVRGQLVTLTPKVFETLVLLVQRAGHVVSKDELMTALWPRGFVHESNLSKHIWLIRRALGDGDDANRCIETIPKLGYRFVAKVETVDEASAGMVAVGLGTSAPVVPAPVPSQVGTGASPAPELPSPAVGESPRPLFRRRVLGWHIIVPVAGVLLIGAVLAAGWRVWHAPVTEPRRPVISDGSAVAIVDFNNLSGHAKDAWLGPALEQMLATEVAVNGKLHVVSEELVRPARADLPVPEAGGYAPPSLEALQRRLGTHYVLSGAYLVSGAPNAPQLRVDLTAQDARTGATFASLSRQGDVAELPGMVAQIGGDLRQRLGEAAATPMALQQVAAEQPPTSEVARHMGFALQALDQYDPARARDELLQAIAQAPGYAPAYAYLARAWSMLGYRAKAVAASSQALHYAIGLPDEERLQIQAQQFDLQADHEQAAATYAKMVALRPGNPDYRLQLVATLTSSGKYGEAATALSRLRALSGANGDPRVELAAASISAAKADPQAHITHARRALELAERRGESGLVASAELRLGIALDQDPQAEPLLRRAASDYRRIGNPHGEALAWQNLANLQNERGELAASRETYQRAMMIYQAVGDLSGQAAIYDDLARMLWNAGDRDGAETALRQALKIARETNDTVRQAWTLAGLATVLADESASDEVAAMYREAIALDRRSGAIAHLVFALASYADVLRMRGELDQARDLCMQAQAGARALKDASQATLADFECAQVALDRGNIEQANAAFAALEQQAISAKDIFGAANAQLELAQIAMGRGQWQVARQALQKSLQGWRASKEAAGEATAGALLALCEAELGDVSARDRSRAAAHDLRGRITQRAEVFQLDIALAEVKGLAGDAPSALRTLQALIEEATDRRWIGFAFEARLATRRLLQRTGDRQGAKASFVALKADAGRLGFGWIDWQLRGLPQSSAAR